MTRGRRDGILKAEKTRHVVKIGSMHLKGVWIPFERALMMANKEKITDDLYPLFVKDIQNIIKQGTPTVKMGQYALNPLPRHGENSAAAAAAAASTSASAALGVKKDDGDDHVAHGGAGGNDDSGDRDGDGDGEGEGDGNARSGSDSGSDDGRPATSLGTQQQTVDPAYGHAGATKQENQNQNAQYYYNY
jgi:enhanced filamentous growth protein 1